MLFCSSNSKEYNPIMSFFASHKLSIEYQSKSNGRLYGFFLLENKNRYRLQILAGGYLTICGEQRSAIAGDYDSITETIDWNDLDLLKDFLPDDVRKYCEFVVRYPILYDF
jgi:hypothetical protein